MSRRRQNPAMNPKLDALVKSGDITSYKLENEDGGLAPNNDRLRITFPSGATLEIRSNCGSEADASSFFEITEDLS